jgi:hypothetical protein
MELWLPQVGIDEDDPLPGLARTVPRFAIVVVFPSPGRGLVMTSDRIGCPSVANCRAVRRLR